MYKNLKKEIIRLKISYEDIFQNCSMSHYDDIRFLTRRLNENAMFRNEEDIEDIYKYLKKRGYKSSKSKKEDIDYLFEYSKIEKESSKITPLSKLIKKRMSELRLSNVDVRKQFKELGVPISITTLNNWKNEGAKRLRDESIDSLAKILKIPKSALYRSKNGDDSYIEYLLDKENIDLLRPKIFRTPIDYSSDEIPIMRFSMADRTLKETQDYIVKFFEGCSDKEIINKIQDYLKKYSKGCLDIEIINEVQDYLDKFPKDLPNNEIVKKILNYIRKFPIKKYSDKEIDLIKEIIEMYLEDIKNTRNKYLNAINENRNKYLQIIDNHNGNLIETIEKDLEEFKDLEDSKVLEEIEKIKNAKTNDSKSKKGRKKDGKK